MWHPNDRQEGHPRTAQMQQKGPQKKIPGRGDRVIYQKGQVTVTAWNGNNVVIAHTSC